MNSTPSALAIGLIGLSCLTLTTTACAQATTPATAPTPTAPATWLVDTQEDWTATGSSAQGMDIVDGVASPSGQTATYSSAVHRVNERQQIASITIKQSTLWQNWQPIENLGPANMDDAPVALTLGPGNYWVFGLYGGPGRNAENFEPQPAMLEGFDMPLLTTRYPHQFDAPGGLEPDRGGYHAWQSRDMVNWVHHGPVTEGFSRWVTSAEYVDGRVYIFYDYPNDQDPHVYADDDLFDGQPGENLGLAFADPTHGSDAGFIRDRAGRFHVIYEDWTPINASRRSWDSPLAGHAVSETGVGDYTILAPAVDNRTTDTGQIGTYRHPHWAQHPDWDSNIGQYHIHEPEQEAYGDWALIGIGEQTYLFGDYDPVGGGHMSVCWFTTRDLNEPFTWCGNIGSGHPDPDICFAEGRFYLFTQMNTDYVSDGPWVQRVQARVGVDTDNDGSIDQWTDWQDASEHYDYVEGFAKQIDVNPATIDTAALAAGFGYQFELRITDATENESKPMIDRVEIEFR